MLSDGEAPDPSAGAKDRADPAGDRPAGRSTAGKLVPAIQRLRGRGVSLQSLSPAEARALLSAQHLPQGEGHLALRSPGRGRHREAPAQELRATPHARRPMDRSRDGALRPPDPGGSRPRGKIDPAGSENLILPSIILAIFFYF